MELFEESIYLSQIVNYSNKIVKNLFGRLITKIGSKEYLLVKVINQKSLDNNILNLYTTKKKIILNWRYLWIKRYNLIEEYYSNSIKGKYILIDESISYYMGLLEMSINLLNEYNNYMDYGYIQHKIINEDLFSNPLNFIIDVKERDFAEYLKYIFFNNLKELQYIEKIINEGKGILRFDLVIARLLYPNYYFEIIDDIILKKVEENELKKIITRSNEYIVYVKNIIIIINKIYPIEKYPSL